MNRISNEEQRARLLAIIQDDVGRIDRLISDISAASRLDAELARADMAPVDMGQLLEMVVHAYRQADPSLVGRLSLVIDTGMASQTGLIVPGLENRLGQVMRNLIDNAVSFIPPDGHVELALIRKAGQVEIRIDDTGPGLPDSGIDKIFERFYSERPTDEAFGSHSGLGLSIVKRIVEAHGGSIVALNRQETDGRILGARFIVTLPT